VHILEFRPEAGSPPAPEIRGLVTILRSADRFSSTEAASARYEERNGVTAWWLQNGWHREVVGVDKQRPVERLVGFEFTPELVLAANRADKNPTELSYAEAQALALRDPDNLRYRMMMQYDFAFPLSNVVLLCIGLPYLMRRARGKPIEGVIAGSLLCVFYFAADFVLKNLGLQGALDPYLAAWLPIVAFGSLGIASYVTMDS
jgi:lipopolysaccharide export LptBFGC system permease protein LptF